MVADGKVLPCLREGCTSLSTGKSRYCSDSCRAKASHARLYKRVKPVQSWTGPRCWCGKPAKFEDHGRPKCGNHALGHRADKERWRRLTQEMQELGYERAKEVIRLARAEQAVEEMAWD
jgi:hypothetical protein